MSKQLFSVDDALEYIEELDDLVLEDADVIDVVELPPEKIDSVTDEEEFADEEELGFGDSKVVSVPGFVEVSCNSVDLVPTTSEEPSTSSAAVNSEVADSTDQQVSKKRKKSVPVKQKSKKAPTTQVSWNKSKNKPE